MKKDNAGKKALENLEAKAEYLDEVRKHFEQRKAEEFKDKLKSINFGPVPGGARGK